VQIKISRRKLAFVALGSAAAQAAQAPAQPENLNELAREQVRKNAETLAKVDLPMSAEPAFQFKA
jgi:hypothetical protein